MNNNDQPPKFVKWAVLIGIVVLINVFAFISVSYAFPEPEFDDFCDQRNRGVIETQQQCEEADGKWMAHQQPVPEGSSGYCDLYHECSQEFQDAEQQHAQMSFLILLGIGAIALIAGTFLKGSSIVAAGLSYGGVVLLFASGVRHLRDLDQLLQILAVGIALILLIAVAYRRFKD